MTRDPQELWFDDVARRIGLADGAAFAAAFDLRPYRLKQIYRAANKELLGTTDEVSTLPGPRGPKNRAPEPDEMAN
ncbi:MAG TPA: hypothetical protein VNF68_04330, partial [Candidatus Baltobacteraceae bacterium]|nr:hypothetical protein [Candidatus Baltobacteraceae bacterium]